MKALHALKAASMALAIGFVTACDTRPPLEAQDLSRPPILELSAGDAALVADRDTFIVIKALLVTAAHGTLAGKELTFSAEVGYVNAMATTNDSGVAILFYYNKQKSITEARMDRIVGTFKYAVEGGTQQISDTLALQLLPGKPTSANAVGSVELAVSRPAVQVKGTGNDDQAMISARVFDIYRNPIKDGTPVLFSIARGPGGGEAFGSGGDTESAATKNGVATVIFKGGTLIGVIDIAAASGGQGTRQALLTVTSGPPQHISIVARKDSAQTAGSRWRMEVQAQLTDAYLNPVKDSIGVLFTLKPLRSSNGSVSIVGSGVTGNKPCADCDSVPGSAFTAVTYRSEVVFDTLEVIAETTNPTTVIKGNLRFAAPLQRPLLRVNYYGGSVFAPSNEPIDTLTVFGTLQDGFGYGVPGARICIATDGGTVLETCQVTGATGQAAYRMTVTSRDQTSLNPFRVINVKLVEQSTGAEGATQFMAIFQ
jgi:hypothetical protein